MRRIPVTPGLARASAPWRSGQPRVWRRRRAPTIASQSPCDGRNKPAVAAVNICGCCYESFFRQLYLNEFHPDPIGAHTSYDQTLLQFSRIVVHFQVKFPLVHD